MDEPTPVTPPVPPHTDQPSADQVRRATFPKAFQGYDREAVHAFLNRVADWVEGGAAGIQEAIPDVKRELERVGERTGSILTAAEEAAARIRAEANEYAASVREKADEEMRRAVVEASQKSDGLIADAEAKAERIIDEAIARRRQLNQAISSLVERRDEIAEEAQRLADDLLAAVEGLRGQDLAAAESGVAEPEAEEAVDDEEAAPVEPEDDATEPEAPDVSGEPTELVRDDERETTVHRTR